MTHQGFTVRRLGRTQYSDTFAAMQAFTDQRNQDTPDEVWVLEHEAVFTQGQAGKAEHLPGPGSIPVVQSDRGGQVTYHGPGQLVLYLLLDLRRRNLGVRDLVDIIEASLMAVLADLGIVAESRRDAPGVYVDSEKIAQLGLRVRRGCTYHGLSLNIDMDLEPFTRINPCGYEGLQVTSIQNYLGGPQDSIGITESLLSELERGLQV